MKHIKIEPSEQLLENWKIWIAIEVVNSFKARSKDKPSVLRLVPEYYSTSTLYRDKEFVSLERLLEEKSLSLQKQYSKSEEIDFYRQELENFYYRTILPRLKQIHQEIVNQETINLKNKILSVKDVSPLDAIDWLNKQSNSFLEVRSRYAKAMQKCDRNLNHLTNDYRDLISKKFTRNLKPVQTNILKRSMQALIGEEYRLMTVLFDTCIQLCTTYIAYNSNSLKLLEQIEKSLRQKSQKEIISLAIFTNLDAVDVKNQRKLLEVWLGGFLVNYWGICPVSVEQIEQRLLENLSPVVNFFFKKFNQEYIKHLFFVGEDNTATEVRVSSD